MSAGCKDHRLMVNFSILNANIVSYMRPASSPVVFSRQKPLPINAQFSIQSLWLALLAAFEYPYQRIALVLLAKNGWE